MFVKENPDRKKKKKKNVNNSQMFQNKSEKYIENNHDPIFLNFRFLLGFHLPLGM